MRIGLFSDTFPPDLNGVANSTYILFQELKKHGHEVYVVATRAGTGFAEWNEGHDVLRLAGVTMKHLYGYAVTTPLHINAMNEIRSLNLDVIHCQTEFGVGIFARMCSRQLNIPLVSTYHTSYEDYTHYVNLLKSDRLDDQMKKAVAWFSRFMTDTSVEVIAPSRKTKELLECYHVTTDIHIVPTGLDLNAFQPSLQKVERTEEIRQEFGISMDERLIIYLGRIAEEKALDLVVDGFELAEKKGCGLKLLIVGGGPDLERLKDYTAEKNITNVLFAGPRPASEVADYYRSADFFVSASLSETQGMTFVEAMASGLPLLARKDSVLEELLIDEKTGWYFMDAEDLAQRILQIETMDEAQLSQMKQAAEVQVQPLSSEVFCQKAVAVYEQAIEAYQSMLVVEDVQVKEDIVQLYLKDMQGHTRDDLKLLMTLEDYYTDGIRKGMRLSQQHIDMIKKKQDGVQAWRGVMRRIAVKDRTRKEVYDWLTKNTECDIETINSIVERLEEKGYIDDERYCAENISRMKAALFGRERMIRDLRKKGIPSEMVQRMLEEEPGTEYENAVRYAKKAASSLPDTSRRMKQNKLKAKLMTKGYDSEIADAVVAGFDFDSGVGTELESLRRCAAKAKKRYERKYSGTKLRNTVYRYCAAQGYPLEDIYVILDEMEWDA
ncbi:MAG: RecX family transcriptional regulator [Solobacterium sp.]|nr:RecX family transcriptional regulator [Solobacterium sp.]